MKEILSIQEVRGEFSGALIGCELTTHPGGEKLLVWANQAGMPGFRIGDAFIPERSETLEIGKRTVLSVDAERSLNLRADGMPADIDSKRRALNVARIDCAPCVFCRGRGVIYGMSGEWIGPCECRRTPNVGGEAGTTAPPT